MWDDTFGSDSDPSSDPSVLVVGETLVDFIPETPGPLPDVETFHRRAGGAPANVAVGLSRLGVTPAFWTRVGDDPFGDFLRRTLEAAGIPDELVEIDPRAKTGLAFVSLDPDADRAFSFHRDRSADTRLQSGRIDDERLEGTDWLHAGGVTLADDPGREATFDILERAGGTDTTVSFDPNARPELWDEYDFADSVDRAFGLADVVKTSREDLEAAGYDCELDDEQLVRSVADDGPHTVFLTLGSAGAVAYATPDAPWFDDAHRPGDGERSADAVVRHDGYPVDAVDTTGAGDGFFAGAIAALSNDEPLPMALEFAGAVAAVTTTEPGAMTALPTRKEVAAFRKQFER
ncbi:Sugar kinase, ribokinase family [Halalkaliarchaeum sp. AArc-CO]|uniref:carbohydrate kinase family protein n=1 Tax=unclassified Halalkaliarchaeum TaxID=2678344 RepID=UPI00217CFE8E|nr:MULTISPECIES: carbohydrate kinase [unclassified Halalkaliarchaeum]MDR5672982.1 carbohydrate kinase [Halalkaliarchaeum sp. AArc-GB]UWG50324.1 Sugar kinase, ribokinase family [Halalkaliarchaeum sp. AArc-CO]